MSINLTLTTDSNSKHKNGLVGYDFNKIYENYPDSYERNSDRVKSLFPGPNYTSLSVQDVAKAQHAHKNELDKFSDSNSLDNRLEEIEGEIATLTPDRDAAVEGSAERENLDRQIEDLRSRQTAIKAQYTDLYKDGNFLFDDTIEDAMSGGETPVSLGFEKGSDAAYNPDFPVETITYSYNKDVSLASQRGKDEDGVVAGTKAPNAAYPANETSDYVAPKSGSGGFGVNPSENSQNDGVLPSFLVTNRYTAPTT